MKRRYTIFIVGFVAFTATVLGVLVIMPPRTGVSKANFDRIEAGMTRAEIGKLLGSYGSDKDSRLFFAEHKLLVRWGDDWMRIDAVFENGVLWGKSFYHLPPETLGEHMRYWFRLGRR
jgi:hypothetical protein